MQRQVLQFLQGYLNARGNAGSEIDLSDDLAVVRYRVPMGRSAELFYWGTGRRQLPLEAGMWLTVIGAEAIAHLPVLCPSMQKLVDEHLMAADLPLAAGAAAKVEVAEMEGPEAVAAFNRLGLFAPIPDDPADRAQAAFIRADYQGEPAAAARFGWADPDLDVVDHVLTQPAFRRRGLGETLMAAMAARAGRDGARRMLLISSQQGRRLYERIGFRTLAPVEVYQHDG
ncbi:GNAT family N-acetyltransferase [Geminicoccus harenae]|uniref:GNAT family N-acetyltransferase n=1 Tax=Geminicoccus harenae TaxID=2498453 RepID=UPI00168BCF1D|nr:GNAT family N-acetyltransferase [Geminicoccus harenae]